MIDFDALAEVMGDLDEDAMTQMLEDVMSAGGQDAQKAMDACQKGMDIVGTRFESGEYFVGDLIYAGELMTKAVDILKDALVKEKTLARVKELMEMVHMPYDDYAKKYPKQLSGGQQQRVGVLRAMATNPPIIIMDEPFGALDPITREILQAEVKKIQNEFHITILFITHDMHEAMKMADRVIFMDQGVIRQQATPRQMLLHPASEEITRFISLQEVGLDEGDLTAEDIMQRIPDGEVSEPVLTVGLQERLSEIGKHVSLSANDPIYVKDDSGKPVGVITIGSILKHLSK